jgi:YidC/Oxa1 family membrane protein insertase
MKMNRTEWTVVILCAAALGWIMTRPPAQKPADKPSDKPAAAETKPGDPAKPADPATPVPTPPPAPVPEETSTIKSGTAEYTFTNIGGGIQQVLISPAQYAGKTDEILNGKFTDDKANPVPRSAIGALSSGAGNVESLAYTKDAQTERSITFSANDPATGLKITKKWELAEPGEGKKDTDGYGYLWNLTVTFTNTGETSRKDAWYLYTGLLGRLHSNDWIQPAATWYADGDAEELDWTAFDHDGFLGIGKRADDTEVIHDLEEMVFSGVHNQYYAVLISPDSVKKDGTTKTWLTRREVNFADGDRGKVTGMAMQSGVGLEPLNLAKNESYTWKGQIYTGPRSGTVLNELGGERRQAMHYGWFRTLSRLFLGLLNTFYGWIGIYAIAIMLLTLLVRVCIWPLHIKATRAMKRMSKLAPMMKDIREKHKEDPQRMNMEVMKLYRDYGVNPLGGCLPLLFQFPIFLGYYNMMKSAVEMRGHSFLWVKDLSMPDTVYSIPIFGGIPINPLPILMTVTMFLQMKISPQPAMADNPQMQMQMKIFKVMPFIFMFFCYNFASALALYWTVQNIISIGQTWLMQRQPDPELKKLPPRPSFAERMMAAQQARQQQMKNKGPKPPRPGGGGGSAWKNDDRKK